METPTYQQVFPGASLRGGSRAVDAITTREGGNIKSIGKGGQVVGRGADLFGWTTRTPAAMKPSARPSGAKCGTGSRPT
jgi:hypothetical protein